MRASQIVCLALLLCVGGALGQTTTNTLAATNSPPPAIEKEGAKWAFSAWAYAYLVPGGGDYVQPTNPDGGSPTVVLAFGVSF